VSVEDHPVQIAVVDDYDVVVAGVANMLEPYRDRSWSPTGHRSAVKDDVDIALYDSSRSLSRTSRRSRSSWTTRAPVESWSTPGTSTPTSCRRHVAWA
jgi:hypothetical protein